MDIRLASVSVHTTNGRGATVDEIVERALDKIVAVSNNAPQPIRDQAIAYRDSLHSVLSFYMKEAVRADRTTIYNVLVKAGHQQLAEQIRKL